MQRSIDPQEVVLDVGGFPPVQQQPLKTPVSRLVRRLVGFALGLLLCVTVLAAFVPFSPSMPISGLDPSWMFAINQGVARGLVFGKDIVFTFGPYGSIYTRLYDPATDRLIFLGSLYLGLCYFLLLLLLAKGQKTYGLFLFGIFLACLIDSRDALLFTYPLILELVVYRISLPDDDARRLAPDKPVEYLLPVLFAPLGLLPLTKVSLLPICLVTVVLCFGVLWLRGNRGVACLSVSVPAVCCALSWSLAGQPISGLPGFISSSRQMIAGYAAAMAFPGDEWKCIPYALASVLILVMIAWAAPGDKTSRLFLFFSYAAFLFTGFKAGFVRDDPWHIISAGTAILAAGILLMFILGNKRSLLPLGMAVLAWACIGHGPQPTIGDDISWNLRNTYGQTFQGLRARLGNNNEFQRRYDASLEAIRAEFPIPTLPGTTDIYSYDQALLLASGNAWSPRPVTQSYSAYSPELAELDLRHLQGASAPDNILFRVEPIDGRLPSLEDGLSWPALINGYSFEKFSGQTAFLRKMAKDSPSEAAEKPVLENAKYEFGEQVALPDSKEPLFARVEIAPTFLGRAWNAVYKLPELHIAMQLRSGKVANYRVIANMMQTDFLITPLVENTEQFVLLQAGGNKYLSGNQVQSITITSDDRRGWLWRKNYSLSLHASNLRVNTESENAVLFDPLSDTKPESASPPSTGICEGMIEAVNGTPPRSEIPTVGNALSVSGWQTESSKDGIVPDLDLVTLTGENGKTLYVRAHPTPRNDVRNHFHHPEMPDPGYAAIMDVSSLSGRYALGLARTYKGKLEICQQFKIPILIVH